MVKKCSVIILFFGIAMSYAVNSLSYQQIFAVSHLSSRSDSIEDIRDHLEDSIDRAEDIKDRTEDIKDRVNDSIQEAAVGPEGRDLRLSFIFTATRNNHWWLFQPAFALVKRYNYMEIGLHEMAINPTDFTDKQKYYLLVSPAIGYVPVLSRPFRFSCGLGSSMQIAFQGGDEFTFSPFIYLSGTAFYAKRFSSTVTLRGRHNSNQGFLYITRRYHELKEGDSWFDMAASVDFYF